MTLLARVRSCSVLVRYSFALVATLLASVVALTLTGPLGLQGIGLLAFPFAVLAAAWFGGMGPGIVAALGAALATAVFFAKPIGSLAIESPKERIGLAVFVMTCVVESTLIGMSRQSERSLGRLHEAVSTSEAKYRLLFERNPEPMWIFDSKTHAVIAANAAAVGTYGYGADEVQGLRLDALFGPGEAVRFFAEERGGDAGLWLHRTKSGERLLVETRSVSALWIGGLASLMVVRDVTELQRAKDAAEHAAKARDRFLMVPSHELRTPLTPALLASTALERRPNVPADIRRSMGIIRDKVRLEAKLIDDLLDFARITNGDFRVEKKPAHVAEIVAGAIDLCGAEALAKGVVLARELPGNLRVVAVDPDRLKQAVTNVIANAVDVAPVGSTVSTWMRDEPTGEVAVGVRHEGGGADIARMFDPFERGATPGAPNGWALGLGLAISKGVAEVSGGSIEASFDGTRMNVVMRLPTVS